MTTQLNLALVLMLAVLAAPGFAQEQAATDDPAAATTDTAAEPAPPIDVLFTIQNNSGVMLMDFLTSVPDSGIWGADMLGGGVVSPGSNATVRTSVLPDACEVSLRMVMADGSEREGAVDLCLQDFYVVE